MSATQGELYEHIYSEIESGKNDNRQELIKAVQKCKELDAILIVAKIDRLSRQVTYISSLIDNNFKFKAVDMPEADIFTIHVIVALAQKELQLISERTMLALAQLKAKGVKLGTPENLTLEAIRK